MEENYSKEIHKEGRGVRKNGQHRKKGTQSYKTQQKSNASETHALNKAFANQV